MKRKSLILVTLLVLLGSVWWVCSPAEGDLPSSESPDLVVAAYNLNFGRVGDPETLRALTARDAHVVLLQETSPEWEEVIRPEMESRFPHQYWVHSDSYPAGGAAVLSRFPLSDIVVSPSAIGWFPAIWATVDLEGEQVRVLNVHLKPPVSESGSLVIGYFTTGAEREAEMNAHLAAGFRAETPTIVAGDFNEQSGGGLQVLLDRGFEDAIRQFHPGEHTWRWSSGGVELTQQLDHVLYGPGIRCLNSKIVSEGLSDHLPIVGYFRLSPRDDRTVTAE